MPKQLSFHRRFEKRALERKQKRLSERGPGTLEAVEKEDAAAIKEQKAKYGKGRFLAADAVVKSADDCILLNRRGKAPQKGVHALPGGKLDEGETFLEACLRELREETGLVAAPDGQPEAIDFAGLAVVCNETCSPSASRPLLAAFCSCSGRRICATRRRLSFAFHEEQIFLLLRQRGCCDEQRGCQKRSICRHSSPNRGSCSVVSIAPANLVPLDIQGEPVHPHIYVAEGLLQAFHFLLQNLDFVVGRA